MTEHSDAHKAAEDPESVRRGAYDLDEDGRVSLTEDARAELGVIDARAEANAEKPGLRGKIASAAHRLFDRFDND